MIYDITDIDMIKLVRAIYGRAKRPLLGKIQRAAEKQLEEVDELDDDEALDLVLRIRKGEFIDYHNGKKMKIDCIWRNGRLLFYADDWLGDDPKREPFHTFMESVFGSDNLKLVDAAEFHSKDEIESENEAKIWRIIDSAQDPNMN